MSAVQISSIVFACVFGGALLGMFLRTILPEHHLSQDSKDVVKLGTGLIATMSALVIGLLIASAKGSFDTQGNEVKQSAANVALLDRVLAQYGPETQEARQVLRRATETWLNLIWPEDGSQRVDLGAVKKVTHSPIEILEEKIRNLTAQNEAQRELQARALHLCTDLTQTRMLLFGQFGSRSIPLPFLIVLIVWLAVIFLSFGLLAPRNATVVVVLLVCALSASGAIFLILEMDRPFEGLMKISGAPLRDTLARLGQ